MLQGLILYISGCEFLQHLIEKDVFDAQDVSGQGDLVQDVYVGLSPFPVTVTNRIMGDPYHLHLQPWLGKGTNPYAMSQQEIYQKQLRNSHNCLGGGFKYFLFSPLFGEDSHFDEYCSKGLKPPTSC